VFYVKDFNTHEVLLSDQSKDGLYALTKSSVTLVPQAYWSPCTSASADLWHRRLGHPTSRIFQLLISKNKIICNNKRLNFQCQSCPLGKSSRLSLGPTGHKTSAPLELIFSMYGALLLFFLQMAIIILLSLLMLILNMYGIILSLPSLMFTLFFINFRLLSNVNFH
jgi:hypothetical protein